MDSDLRWLSSKDAKDLGQLTAQGVKIRGIGSPATPDKLENLVVNDVEARTHDEIEKSYYIIDGETVVMRIGRGSTGIVFSDESMASLFIEELQEVFKEASEVPNIAT